MRGGRQGIQSLLLLKLLLLQSQLALCYSAWDLEHHTHKTEKEREGGDVGCALCLPKEGWTCLRTTARPHFTRWLNEGAVDGWNRARRVEIDHVTTMYVARPKPNITNPSHFASLSSSWASRRSLTFRCVCFFPATTLKTRTTLYRSPFGGLTDSNMQPTTQETMVFDSGPHPRIRRGVWGFYNSSRSNRFSWGLEKQPQQVESVPCRYLRLFNQRRSNLSSLQIKMKLKGLCILWFTNVRSFEWYLNPS